MSVLNIFQRSNDANLGQTLMRLARLAQVSHQSRLASRHAGSNEPVIDDLVEDVLMADDEPMWDADDPAWNDETVADYVLDEEHDEPGQHEEKREAAYSDAAAFGAMEVGR